MKSKKLLGLQPKKPRTNTDNRRIPSGGLQVPNVPDFLIPNPKSNRPYHPLRCFSTVLMSPIMPGSRGWEIKGVVFRFDLMRSMFGDIHASSVGSGAGRIILFWNAKNRMSAQADPPGSLRVSLRWRDGPIEESGRPVGCGVEDGQQVCITDGQGQKCPI
jgi:hypothetical protein